TVGTVSVGRLLERGVHRLDLIRVLTGGESVEVQCTMDPLPSDGPDRSAKVLLRTTDDILCSLDIARVETNRVGAAEWVGTAGKVTADWPARKVKRTAANGTLQEWTVQTKTSVLGTFNTFVHAIRTCT